jgi:hypothetical protein
MTEPSPTLSDEDYAAYLEKTQRLQAQQSELDWQAYEMRILGRSYRQIAKEMDVATSTAYQRVQRIMQLRRNSMKESTLDICEMELTKLQLAEQKLMPRVLEGDVESLRLFLRLVEVRRRHLILRSRESRKQDSGEHDPLQNTFTRPHDTNEEIEASLRKLGELERDGTDPADETDAPAEIIDPAETDAPRQRPGGDKPDRPGVDRTGPNALPPAAYPGQSAPNSPEEPQVGTMKQVKDDHATRSDPESGPPTDPKRSADLPPGQPVSRPGADQHDAAKPQDTRSPPEP